MSALPGDSDYTRYQPDVRRWESVAEFIAAPAWASGVHVVMLSSGAHIDMMLGGDFTTIAPGRGVPVVLSGAVSKREGRPGPFFSGIGLGMSLETPFVAISDPTLTVDRMLRLGWYAGRAGEDLQGHLVTLLEDLQRRVGRPLLLAGGSGAGFACMLLGARLDVPASAMVWNPQTDLLDYDEGPVLDYLCVALGMDRARVTAMSRQERSAALAAGGVQHAVSGTTAAAGLTRLLYLQNAGDHHVIGHLAPFLERDGYQHEGGGRWRNSRGHLALVSNFSESHDPPPRPAMDRAMDLLLDPAMSVDRVVDLLQEERLLPRTDLELLPRDLRGEADDIANRTSLTATQDADGTVRATVVWEGRASRYGGVTTHFEVVDADGAVLSSHLQRSNALALRDADARAAGVRAHVRDGFLNEILTLSAELTRTPQRVKVVVVGSHVTRDTFAFLDPGLFHLGAFVARQSLISAFGPAGAPPFDPSVLPSPFQQRMVEGDARSSLAETVAAAAADLVLWDLFDERFGVLEQADGTVTTDSVELRRARDGLVVPTATTALPFGTPEHLERFVAALHPWRELLESRDLLGRIAVLAPRWAQVTNTGGSTPWSAGIEPVRADAITDDYLAAVHDVLGVPVLGRSLTTRAASTHHWGVAPFHYDDPTYVALATEIAAFTRDAVRPWAWDEASPRACVRAPSQEDRDPRKRAPEPSVVMRQTAPSAVTVEVRDHRASACSFALHEGARRVDATPYARVFSHTFAVPRPGIYRCRVYLLTEIGDRIPVTSPPLRVSGS